MHVCIMRLVIVTAQKKDNLFYQPDFFYFL
ncbi:MAG: hypothetical protein JWP12_1541 [Bacteroidetes bacterium]|nr:hypothetical protein [Bacteroidota bacterium]